MGKLIHIEASPRGSRSASPAVAARFRRPDPSSERGRHLSGPSMKSVIVITGASSGFGELAARALTLLRQGRSR